ncbi:MAG TPA: MFS transporter [Planctomycetota bacterium]|nr:MFS transporter [Planctomycetota bacterium]
MRRTSVLVVFLTVFIDLLGFGILIPLLPLYAKEFGATEFLGGLLVAVYSLMQFLFAPMWGHISDRVGRKPVLAFTLAGNALSYVLFALGASLPVLFVARAMSGFFAANIATAQAYVADVTTHADRARGMGMIGMAFGLGFVFGPAIGAGLSHFGHWAPAAASAFLSGVAALLATFKLRESLTPELRASASRRRAHPILTLREGLASPATGGLFVLFFFLVFGFANLESMLPYFLLDRHGWGKAETGLLFTYIGVCIAFAQGFLFRRLAGRFGEARLLRVGPILIAVGMQMYWLFPTWWLLLLAVPIVAIGMGLTSPSIPSLISKRTPPDMQGRTLGLSQSLGSLARALSPGLAGWMYKTYPRPGGSIVPFLWGGAVMVVGLLFSLRSTTVVPPGEAGAPTSPPA